MKRFRAIWQSLWGDADRRVRLGRFLGLTFIGAGFVVFYFAWDGAASINFAQGQIPYLLSGGFLGLGLVITGATLLFLSTIRSERQLMTDRYDDMARLLSRNLSRLQISSNGSTTSSNAQVVVGATTYHLAECNILEGKDGLTTVTVEQAIAEGLERCRVCNPPEAKTKDAEPEAASAN